MQRKKGKKRQLRRHATRVENAAVQGQKLKTRAERKGKRPGQTTTVRTKGTKGDAPRLRRRGLSTGFLRYDEGDRFAGAG